MLHRLCRIAVLGAALAAASVSHAQLIIPGGSSSGSGATPGGSSGQLQFNNAGAFGGGAGTAWDDTNRALTISGATVTSSKPLLDLSQTWNAGGVAFSALKLNVTDTASANGSLLLDLQVGGVSKFNISKIGSLTAAGSISAYSSGLWSVSDSGGIFLGASSDVVLKRDAANTLALRNGANAQTFNIYNTYTDASNYERGFIGFSSNAFYIQTQAAGTGTASDLYIRSASNSLYFGTGGAQNWQISSGNLLASTDNTVDIGSSGTYRPRNVYVAGSVYATDLLANTNGGVIAIGSVGDVKMYRDAANMLALRNGASAQQFNVYKTYTDALNYERASFYWSGNLFYISTVAAGTGTARSLVLTSAGTTYIGSGGGNQWFVNSSTGHWVANIDNTYDIGASGANRARNAYLAGKIVTGSTTLHETSVALTNGAAAATGTLTNAPAAGNPTKWFPINDNGTTRYVPAW